MSYCDSNRKMFLIDAIRYELNCRKQERYAELARRIADCAKSADLEFVNPLFEGDTPPLDYPHLARSFEYALMWDARAYGVNR